MQVESNPKRGAERFISIDVERTDDPTDFNTGQLDPKGRERFGAEVQRPYRAVRGRASISWKSHDDREKCIAHQERRGRWRCVLCYMKAMQRGELKPGGPVYLDPSITGSDKLRAIDGTRRLMACLEAGIPTIDVVIIVGVN